MSQVKFLRLHYPWHALVGIQEYREVGQKLKIGNFWSMSKVKFP
jgi:hypothetical protein